MKEIWKDIKDYEGFYKVSNLGNIISLDRVINRSDGVSTFVKEKRICFMKNGDGYLSFKLCKYGKSKTVRVHRIVAETFVENSIGELAEVNHIDMNRTNNKSSNLEWITHLDNIRHSSSKWKYIRNGERNSNYGGTKLKDFYRDNPEEKMKLARKGLSNGRCKRVMLLDINRNKIKEFGFIRECSEYIIEIEEKNTSPGSVSNYIRDSINKNNPLYGKYYFEFI